MAESHMFVYGTLMHKSHCRGWGEEAEIAPPRDGTAKGNLHDYGPYPYADLDGDGVIHGQVLTVDDATVEYQYICNVETGAGYQPRIIDVKLTSGEVLPCLAWHGYRDYVRQLPIIASGDWNAREAERHGEAAFLH